jgi:hypothetical protein
MYLRVAQEQLYSTVPPFPRLGPPVQRSPTSSVAMKVLRLPVPNADSLMDSLARSNPSSPCLLPLRQRPPQGPGPVPARRRQLISIGRTQDLPGSWSFLPLSLPRSPTPVGLAGLTLAARSVLSPLI